MYTTEYLNTTIRMMEDLEKTQGSKITDIAFKVAESIKGGGVLHLFGCGHSSIPVCEAFYRAGGLVPVNPIFDSSLLLHGGAVKSSQLERLHGFAETVIAQHQFAKGEVLVVFSNSGINAVPVEMAMEGKKRDLYVVAVSSSAYQNEASRHQSGKKLPDVADCLIDTLAPKGDAVISLENGQKIAPASTLVCCTFINLLICDIAQRLNKNGEKLPFFASGNIESGDEQNRTYIEQYRKRVKSL